MDIEDPSVRIEGQSPIDRVAMTMVASDRSGTGRSIFCAQIISVYHFLQQNQISHQLLNQKMAVIAWLNLLQNLVCEQYSFGKWV